jgi:hypothetical protein
MLWVFLRDEMVHMPDGETVVTKQGMSSVHDHKGRVISSYDAQSVLMYTGNEQLASLLQGAFEASAQLPRVRPSE